LLLGTRRWILDVGYWILDTGEITGHFISDTCHSRYVKKQGKNDKCCLLGIIALISVRFAPPDVQDETHFIVL
jgi:hypothetical protein